jgi:hypothetical protein
LINFNLNKYDDIPLEFKVNLNGEKFLYFDSGFEDEERVLIFYSKFICDTLKRSMSLLLDGTFKVCPSQFYQLYIVHGFFLGRSYPFIYVLMRKKSFDSYSKVFKFLNQELNFESVNLVFDFETAAFSAASIEFSKMKVFGCLFHFGQSLWRNMQAFELSSLYNNNKIVRNIIRRRLNLSFYPAKEIEIEFLKIKKCGRF